MAAYKYWCPAAEASSSSPGPLNPSMCLVPANPDISGIGVRIAIYLQNLLGFIPAVWAVWDWKVTDHELESAETQSTTNLVLAFAILTSCIVQAFTLGLTSYHATVVLSLSWMNNTNAFIYFLLYVHYKSQGLEPQVAPQWSSWIKHIQDQTKALFSLPTISPATTIGGQAATHNVASQTGRKDGKGGVKVLFRRVALFLGSLHLTLMAGLGIWLWSSPRSFGIADASCAVDSAHLAIVGARVPFGSNALRVVSLAVYSLFILPGFNLLLPMSAFLGLYLWHHARWVKVQSGTSASAAVGPIRARIARMCRAAVASPVFAVFVGLGFLLVVNIVFVADIELTLRRNQGIQETEEKQWGFGQILAMLLVFLPLRDVVEMILARRLHRQEEQIRKHVQAAAWTKAVLRKDVSSILQLVDEGADPNISVEGGWTALEVAIVAQNSNAVHFLTHARHCAANVAIKFHDGRTPLQVAALDDNWEMIRTLVDARVDIDAVNADGQTALELAALEKKWGVVEGLITAGANPNLIFRDGRTVLELAANGRRWGTVRCLAGAAADLNHCFKGCKPDVWGEVDDGVANVRTILHAACYHREHDLISFLLEKGADPNAVAFEAEDEGKPGPPLMGAFEYGSAFHYVCSIEGDAALPLVRKALECGADPNLQGGELVHVYGTPLQSAKSPTVVELLLEQGADPKIQGGEYGTALHAACARGHLSIVTVLLDKGVDPNLRSGMYVSALQAACAGGHISVVRTLLDRGADPNIQGGKYGSALQAACARRELGIAKLLLDQGADPNLPGGEYQSPLQAACVRGELDIVKFLVDRGADPNLKAGGRHGSALHAVCARGELDMARFLLDKGADPNLQGGKYGSPLQAACVRGALGITKLLLDNGADPNLQGGEYGTALQAACVNGQLDIVKALLDSAANPNLQGEQIKHGSALQAACARGAFDITKVLLDGGADPNLSGGEYGSALRAACARGELDIATLLLDKGADPNFKGGKDGTPLKDACVRGSPKIVKILLEMGVDPNSEGGSALYAVCIDGSLDIARLLLEKGADPNLQGVLSGAALYAACAGKHNAIAQLLLEHHADPNIQGQGFQGFSRGLTVLQRVQELMVEKTWNMNELDAIAALLRQYGAG